MLRLLIAGFIAASASGASAAPQRVVSLNLCADQLVLRLLPPERIASVTWLARDADSSTTADLAKNVPVNQGLAEEVMGLDPDLVLSGAYTARPAVDILKRHGRPVLDLAVPASFAEGRAQMRAVADAVGAPKRGARLVADMDARLAAVPSVPAERRLKALMLGPNGFATGYGPLVDEMLARAGLDNLAPALGTPGGTGVPLETAILAEIDLVIVDGSESTGPSLAHAVLDHPAIRALTRKAQLVHLPSKLWTCAGPQLADAVDILAKARTAYMHK